MDEPRFRTDLYAGTAAYYDRYRLPYPDVLLDGSRARVPTTGRGRLADLACGTGQIAFALAADFAEIWAVDIEAEAEAFAAAKAQRLGADRIHWLVAAAEDPAVDPPFELVAIGNAFHRVDRERVAAVARSLLAPGGALALLWGGSPWAGDRPWQRLLSDVVERWTALAGATDRVPAGWDLAMAEDPTEAVLARAGFTYAGHTDFLVPSTWTVGELIGFVYSTSVLSRPALGPHLPAFEQDCREQLLAHEPSGVFRADASFGYDLAFADT